MVRSPSSAEMIAGHHKSCVVCGVHGIFRRAGIGRWSRHIDDDAKGPIPFLGGKDYVPLFCYLTSKIRAERIVFYNSSEPPEAPGCQLKRYHTRTRTNWYYECVAEFLAKISSTTKGRREDES